MNQSEFYRRVGSSDQLFGIKDYRFIGGKADAMRAVELYNAAGLSLTVLPDRGMDIASLSYCGTNISFLSKTGLTNSPYFTEDGAKGFLKSFYAGFLTTGGLTYMGAADEDEGENLGLHGVVSNIPASEVCPRAEWNANKDNVRIEVSGRVKQAQVFGEHMVMNRRISMPMDRSVFMIEDKIENLGFEKVPFMILYHINFGYPMLSPSCELLLPTTHVTPRDNTAQEGLSEYRRISDPIDGYEEQVFFHEMAADKGGQVRYMLINRDLELGVEISYPAEQLTHFTHWKCMRSGEYVLGLEPGNCHVMGRNAARKDGSLKFMEPGESRNIKIEVRIHKGADNISKASMNLIESFPDIELN